MPKILVSIPHKYLTDDRRHTLEACSGDLDVLITEDPKVIEDSADDIEIALGGIPRELIAKMTNLKWYQQFGTGTEWLLKFPDCIKHPFVLSNCSDDYGVVLAEHMMALMLAFARQLPEFFEAQQRSAWERHEFNDPRRFELRGKTLLILGLGSIGKEVAKRAAGFDMRIIGMRSNPEKPVDGVGEIFGNDALHEALSQADLIVNTLPHTPETIKLIDGGAIAAMKPSAYLFNIGRGTTIDESALINALQSGKLAGAGLDVFETEPLPEESPLWKLPNVIITPHEGGNHGDRTGSWVNTIFDNLTRYSQGLPLRNVVDKDRSY